MPSVREFFLGDWRAVPVLGVTQILAWGAIFYTPVLIVPLIAAERGFSITFAMGGLSVGLLAGGCIAPTIGGLIDRHGGHRVMPFGSLAGAVGLVAITYAASPVTYYAAWIVLGAAMAASLYDPAFATLGRIFGANARQPITVLTLAGGFASTVSWPTTYALLQSVGWKGTYLVYAAPSPSSPPPCTRSRCRAHAPTRQSGTSKARRRRQRRTRRPVRSSCSWSRRFPPTPSSPPVSRRICWRSSNVPGSMPVRSSSSARCSDRRRSQRGCASLFSPAISIHLLWCVLRSRCWRCRSRHSGFLGFRLRPPSPSRSCSAWPTALSLSRAARCRSRCSAQRATAAPSGASRGRR